MTLPPEPRDGIIVSNISGLGVDRFEGTGFEETDLWVTGIYYLENLVIYIFGLHQASGH